MSRDGTVRVGVGELCVVGDAVVNSSSHDGLSTGFLARAQLLLRLLLRRLLRLPRAAACATSVTPTAHDVTTAQAHPRHKPGH